MDLFGRQRTALAYINSGQAVPVQYLRKMARIFWTSVKLIRITASFGLIAG